jgi:hypothetical protein
MEETWKKRMRMKEAQWKKERIVDFSSRQREAVKLSKTIRTRKVSNRTWKVSNRTRQEKLDL